MNIEDTYFKEREFPTCDTMPSFCRNFIPERRNFVVGYIDDMNKHVGKNYWVWTRDKMKYLVKYVLLKHKKNICILYYLAKDNPEVIDHGFGDTVVGGDDVFSGVDEE